MLGTCDKDIEDNDNIPDLWYIKAELCKTDVHIHNYCIIKAQALRKEGYEPIVFTDEDLKKDSLKIIGEEIFSRSENKKHLK
jgi:hypothetical protein